MQKAKEAIRHESLKVVARFAGRVFLRQKLALLVELQSTGSLISMQLKQMRAYSIMSYHNNCATLIQKRWRGMQTRKKEFPIAKRFERSRMLIRAIVQGFKIRKIWACKEVVTYITTIKDIENLILQWKQEQSVNASFSNEIQQLSLDRKKRVEKLIMTIKRLYQTGDWLQTSSKAKKPETRFIPEYRPSVLEEKSVHPFSIDHQPNNRSILDQSFQSEIMPRKDFSRTGAASVLEVYNQDDLIRPQFVHHGEDWSRHAQNHKSGPFMITRNSQSDLSRTFTYEDGPPSSRLDTREDAFTPVREADLHEYLKESPLDSSAAFEQSRLEKKQREALIQEKAKSFLRRKKVYNPQEAIQKARSSGSSRLSSKDRQIPPRGKSSTIKEVNSGSSSTKKNSNQLKRIGTVGNSPSQKLENTSSTRAFLKKKVHNLTSKSFLSLRYNTHSDNAGKMPKWRAESRVMSWHKRNSESSMRKEMREEEKQSLLAQQQRESPMVTSQGIFSMKEGRGKSVGLGGSLKSPLDDELPSIILQKDHNEASFGDLRAGEDPEESLFERALFDTFEGGGGLAGTAGATQMSVVSSILHAIGDEGGREGRSPDSHEQRRENRLQQEGRMRDAVQEEEDKGESLPEETLELSKFEDFFRQLHVPVAKKEELIQKLKESKIPRVSTYSK